MPSVRRGGVVSSLLLVLFAAGCSSGEPDEAGLRDSFVAQLTANRFVKDVQRSGDELRFSAPGAEGEASASWRVHIDSAVVERSDNAANPYRGVVKSSWFANDRQVLPRGSSSNLPLELTSNGLAQECWALWDPAARRWGWE